MADILVPPPVLHGATLYSSDRGGSEVTVAVVHALSESVWWPERLSGAPDRYVPALEWLSKKIPGRAGVSAHAMIEPSGRVTLLCPESRAAWHAGVSRWQDLPRRDGSLNHCSLGVEILVAGEHDYDSFLETIRGDWPTAEQYYSAGWLLHDWQERHAIAHIPGHDQVAGDDVRGPGRGKRDPGAGFNWQRLFHQLERWAPDSG